MFSAHAQKCLEVPEISSLFLLILTVFGRPISALSRESCALAVPSQQYVHLLFAGPASVPK
jgi:hypothetical protein